MLVKRKDEKKRKFPEPAGKEADSPAVPEFAGCIFSEVRYVKGVSVSGWGPPVYRRRAERSGLRMISLFGRKTGVCFVR